MSELAQKCKKQWDFDANLYSNTVNCFKNGLLLLFQLQRESTFLPKKFYNIDHRFHSMSSRQSSKLLLKKSLPNCLRLPFTDTTTTTLKSYLNLPTKISYWPIITQEQLPFYSITKKTSGSRIAKPEVSPAVIFPFTK